METRRKTNDKQIKKGRVKYLRHEEIKMVSQKCRTNVEQLGAKKIKVQPNENDSQ